MTTFKIWGANGMQEISIGDSVTVFKCGGCHTTFGEKGVLLKATKLNLVFKTESGAIVKTDINNLMRTVGVHKDEWSVSTRDYDSFTNMIHTTV